MTLDPEEAVLFFKLSWALLYYVGSRVARNKQPAGSVAELRACPPEERQKLWEALVENISLIDDFVQENPDGLDPDELEIVRSWKDLVAGQFYVLRFLKKHTIFLASSERDVAYGVLALSEPFDVVINQPLPFFCKTVLLPFRGRIIYDGILAGYNVFIGGNMTRELNKSYSAAKDRDGVVISLPRRPETKDLAKPSKPQKRQSKPKRGFTGVWQVSWIENWDQDDEDSDVEWLIKFGGRSRGMFRLGYVVGEIDYRTVDRDGKPGVEFTWEGGDEMEPVNGRGLAVLDGDELHGKIFIHWGDEFEFRAFKTGR